MVYGYWTVGARVRRAYREAEARGGTLWLDEEPTRHREAAMRDR
jgi:hypothetical protein